MPLRYQTGTPRHFHSSTISGSACLIRPRSRASNSPRQSPRSRMRWSISSDGLGAVSLIMSPSPVSRPAGAAPPDIGQREQIEARHQQQDERHQRQQADPGGGLALPQAPREEVSDDARGEGERQPAMD